MSGSATAANGAKAHGASG